MKIKTGMKSEHIMNLVMSTKKLVPKKLNEFYFKRKWLIMAWYKNRLMKLNRAEYDLVILPGMCKSSEFLILLLKSKTTIMAFCTPTSQFYSTVWKILSNLNLLRVSWLLLVKNWMNKVHLLHCLNCLQLTFSLQILDSTVYVIRCHP